MSKLMKCCNLFILSVMGLTSPFLFGAHNDERDRIDVDARDEYNLYERNRDNRDFNRFDYPDTRGNRGNSDSYYNNNQNDNSNGQTQQNFYYPQNQYQRNL